MEYVTVAQEGFYGLYHVPVKDHDPKKVVIVVGGSEGNENIPMNVGAMFARCGWSYVKKKYKLNMPFLRLAYPARASAFSSNAA